MYKVVISVLNIIYLVLKYSFDRIELNEVNNALIQFGRLKAKRKMGKYDVPYATTENFLLIPVEASKDGVLMMDSRGSKFLFQNREIALLKRLDTYVDRFNVLWELSLIDDDIIAQNAIGDTIIGIKNVQGILSEVIEERV